ncbi:hypothetical protein V8G54_005070 [Vigna mungo]|uniref:Uncharacterized protein n=1 Tax=Vigna mungo TaxID=3915 RepID=A0AAQ3PEV6_VIGMU
MQLQFKETKLLLQKEREAAKREAARAPVIQEVPVVDHDLLEKLTSENEKLKTLDRLPLLPEEALLGCVSSASSSSWFPSYDQTISQCHGLKLHCSNLKDKVVLQRGVMIGHRGIGA